MHVCMSIRASLDIAYRLQWPHDKCLPQPSPGGYNAGWDRAPVRATLAACKAGSEINGVITNAQLNIVSMLFRDHYSSKPANAAGSGLRSLDSRPGAPL